MTEDWMTMHVYTAEPVRWDDGKEGIVLAGIEHRPADRGGTHDVRITIFLSDDGETKATLQSVLTEVQTHREQK